VSKQPVLSWQGLLSSTAGGIFFTVHIVTQSFLSPSTTLDAIFTSIVYKQR